MKVAVLIGIKATGEPEVIDISNDVDMIKKKQKELKLKEKSLNYIKTMLMGYPSKTYSMKPELKKKAGK